MTSQTPLSVPNNAPETFKESFCTVPENNSVLNDDFDLYIDYNGAASIADDDPNAHDTSKSNESSDHNARSDPDNDSDLLALLDEDSPSPDDNKDPNQYPNINLDNGLKQPIPPVAGISAFYLIQRNF